MNTPKTSGTWCYIGIDVSKLSLDAAGGGLALHVPNTRAGCESIFAEAQKLKRRVHFVYESTGVYASTLQRTFHSHGSRLSMIPAYKIRQFGNATGKLAKTDPIDAKLIAEAAKTFRPEPDSPPNRNVTRLRVVTRRRTQLVRARVKQCLQLSTIAAISVRKVSEPLLRVLEKQIDKLDEMAAEIVERDPRLRALSKKFCAVAGVGPVTAHCVLGEMPEIGSLSRGECAALMGLAPYNKDSGEKVGIRHIKGGRVHVRSALYHASTVAVRCNEVLRPFYLRLREKGKLPKVALTAVTRKLGIYLNHLARPVVQAADEKAAARKMTQ